MLKRRMTNDANTGRKRDTLEVKRTYIGKIFQILLLPFAQIIYDLFIICVQY